ncbi:ABC transporter ATP-binding protein [Anaerosporobacter faecicola]|uniref:ABC transporter ATP-binding protein n=1 Tax=Anaerosporobacter faecicola TaxID=2718714 RepID=UPI002ED41DA7
MPMKGKQNHILKKVSVAIYKGDFTVIMGSSGSGKSTLLYSLSGMDCVNAGEILYKGEDLCKMKENTLAKLRQKDFGFVFQQMHLVSNLTLYENVVVSGYLNKDMAAKDVESYAKQLLDRMGLQDKYNRLPSQVSGGEQQRAAIARAVISKPALLFADEPTGALNRKNTNEVLDLLSQLHEDGQSILMVTHDMKAALRANRILYLEDGTIVGELTLPPYGSQDDKKRETQVNAWLSSLEW